MNYFYQRTIDEGGHFGELALIVPNGRRTATIIACEDSYLGVISKQKYKELFDTFLDDQTRNQCKYFKENLFHNLTTESILEVLYSIKQECITENHLIYKEGDDTEPGFYFVKSGEIHIEKRILLLDYF